VASGSVVELAPLLRKTVAEMNGTSRRVVFDCQAVDLAVAAEEDRLAAVVEHLIQNALEASPEDGVVQVRLRDHDSNAIIEIADRGHGMDAKFVRDDLFRPFKTTKGTGYGIGVYESREFVREMGGRLDVFSEPGEGTTMRVSLPTIGGLPETDENRLKATAQ
jgi:signal transduction histidine kinase